MKTAVSASRTSRAAGLALIGLLVLACSGAPAATQQGTAPTAGTTSAGPVATADAPSTTPPVAGTPAEPAATATAPGSTPDVFAVVPASEDASATVQLGGQTYLFQPRAVPEPGVPSGLCSLDDRAVVVGLLSADLQSFLRILAGHDGVRSDGTSDSFSVQITFQDEQRGELWMPTETVPFNVSGSTATWNGTMSERLGTGGEEQVAITIDCAN